MLSLAWLDPGPLLLLVALSIAGLFYGLIIPSRDMMVRSVTPPESVGKVFGFVSTGLNVGSAITPLLFGLILDAGNAHWFFYLVPLFMALSAASVAATAFARR